MESPSDALRPSADSLFAAWLVRREAGEEADFEVLCLGEPQHAQQLRKLHEQWHALRAILAQAGLAGSLSERLNARFGAGIDPSVTLESQHEEATDFSSEVLRRLAGRGPASKRYRLQGEIAHGGMGAILRTWDEDLRRHLAMKVILGQARADHSGETPQVDRRLLARFLEEAQITGQLEHPGIVPVHELGLDGEGRVYFTMKLVEGRHFGDVLELVRQRREGWSQTRALGVIQKVCDAMAYAHSRGVVHRDLKPANVMVGRFGEVYVMDWGLARILGSQGQAGQLRVESEREAARELDPTSSLHTLHGAVMGTPAYMPPEQALGRIDEIGPPADVYAVGAMLYHLLAGHPPYIAPGTHLSDAEICRQVRAGPPAVLLAEAHKAPPELVAICERAMARDAATRYPDMSALAKDLDAYLEGRVVRAYETGAWAETRKWILRNKPLASSLSAAVLLLVAGLVVSLDQKARADEKTLEAQANLNLAKTRADEAESSARRADQERGAADRVISFMVDLFREADPAVHHGSERTVRELLDRGTQLVHGELAEDDLIRARLTSTMGQAYMALGLPREAIPLLTEALRSRESSLTPGDPETTTARHNLASALLEAGDFAEAEVELRCVLEERERSLGPNDPETLDTANNVTVALFQTLRYEEARWMAERVLTGYRAQSASMPNDLCLALINAAGVDRSLGHNAEAKQKLFEALDLAATALTLPHPTHQRALEHMTLTCYTAEEFAEAEDFGQEALAEAESLYGESSGLTQSSLDLLGSLYLRTGRLAAAEDALMRSLQIGRALYQPGDRAVVNPMNTLAGVYANSNRYAEAEQMLEEVLRVSQARYGRKSDYAVSALNNLGSLYVQLNRFEDAEPLLVEAMTIRIELLGEENPSTWISMSNVALLRMSQKRWREAEELLTRLIDLVPSDHPDHPRYLQVLDEVQAKINR